VQGDPERVWMRRVAGGIPQYTVGHLSRVAAFDAMEEKMPGLFFAGDSLHGVGVNAVLKRALVVADRLCASR
jgi:protoporphyrinogen/coproporphyrinogen III oxidase